MLGKLIEHADTREEAASRLALMCKTAKIWPVRTNLGFVARALEHPDFLAGDIDTGFIERNLEALAAPELPVEEMAREAGNSLFYVPSAAMTALRNKMAVERSVWKGGPWETEGFRLNAPSRAEGRVVDEFGIVHRVDLLARAPFGFGATHGAIHNADFIVSFAAGEARTFRVYKPEGTASAAAGDGAIVSPMPGKIIALEVAAGDIVTKGQKLLTLEAMKMEHSLTAPFDGKVAELNAEAGAQVTEGALLVRIEKGEGA
jgi:3-methylcrotonyl-CoA carboxylase alpha subunit